MTRCKAAQSSAQPRLDQTSRARPSYFLVFFTAAFQLFAIFVSNIFIFHFQLFSYQIASSERAPKYPNSVRIAENLQNFEKFWRKSPFSAYSGQVKSRIAQARRVSGGTQGKFQRKSEKEKAVLPLCTSYKEQEASWAPKRTNYLNHVKCGIKNSIVITLLGKDSHFACKDAVSISRAEIALVRNAKIFESAAD